MAKELPKPDNAPRIRDLCQCGHSLHGCNPDDRDDTSCTESSCNCERFVAPEEVTAVIAIPRNEDADEG